MSDWLLILLACLATYRATRLITADHITAPLRDKVSTEKQIGYLIRCDFCMGTWVGLLMAYLAVWHGDNRFVLFILIALTASAATGLIAQREPVDE